MSAKRHDDSYIDRKIATVRNHRGGDNCWPQWANIFADEIEDLRAAATEGRAAERELQDDIVAARARIAQLEAALNVAKEEAQAIIDGGVLTTMCAIRIRDASIAALSSPETGQ